MPQLLVQLQVKYGKVDAFCEIMRDLVPVMEAAAGWKLLGAYRTTIGQLWECWDLWEVPEGLAGVSLGGSAVGGRDYAGELATCLESETLRLLESLPYAPGVS